MKGAITTLCILGAFCCLFFGDVKTRVLRAIVTFGMLILLLLVCAGCTQKARDDFDRASNEIAKERNSRAPNEVSAYRDSETGCEYVTIQGRSLTPRMGADGKQICRRLEL